MARCLIACMLALLIAFSAGDPAFALWMNPVVKQQPKSSLVPSKKPIGYHTSCKGSACWSKSAKGHTVVPTKQVRKF